MTKIKKAIPIIAIILIFLIVIIFTIKPSKNEYTFEEAYNLTEEIGKKYNTSFQTEELNRTMPTIESIEPMLKDLKKFESKLNKDADSYGMKAVFIFLDIRKLMLTSQW